MRGAGRIYWNEANTVAQNFYAVPDLSLWFRAGKWSLKLWCRNVSSTRYDTFYFMSMGNEFVQHALPRQFGATFRLAID
ncbi:MAG: hypothetical protein K2F63_04535 [Muribaculaceae bacterium]|nr:hypothetical protein [Muribaculaceae bacterium]